MYLFLYVLLVLLIDFIKERENWVYTFTDKCIYVVDVPDTVLFLDYFMHFSKYPQYIIVLSVPLSYVKISSFHKP
jgi:hypothetical protein